MSRIHLLSPELANMIAAGEVVERPASVVKELIENAVDAEARDIEIRIQDAGRTLISVRDDGIGMDEADALLAFTRHATSKLSRANDLFRIRTLGFRGEALPSIAAVSKVTLQTGTGEGPGTLLRLRDNAVVEVEKSDGRKGTTVTVEELFYRTPARLKHLRSDYTELAHIVQVVSKAALAHPQIRMTLMVDQTVQFQSSGRGNRLEILANVYGAETARQLLPVAFQDEDFHVTGYISMISLSKANRNDMTFLLNGRNVRIPFLQSVILEAYRNLIAEGRFPLVLLVIEAEPSLVDVNVHPAKHEIRLSKDDALTKLTRAGITQALRQATMAPRVSMTKKETMPVPQNWDHVLWSQEAPNPYQTQESTELSVEKQVHHELEEATLSYEADSSTASNFQRLPPLFPVGQIHGTYIVAQSPEGFYLIDQHAAAERIHFEQFSKAFDQLTQTISWQPLLVPLVLELSYHDATWMSERLSFLRDIGIQAEFFGNNALRILAVPTWMQQVDVARYVEMMVNQLKEQQTITLPALRASALETLSCKASIKANHPLNQSSMEALLNELRQCDNPFTCPHGRPTMIYYSTYELERLFRRVGKVI